METSLATAEPAAVAVHDLAEQARDYIGAARSASTIRAYQADIRDFTSWCARHGVSALPARPDTVSLYLTDQAATRKASTLQRRLTAISQAHQAAGLESPTGAAVVRAVWRGIRRTIGTAYKQKTPATVAVVRELVATLPPTVAGVRDRALILAGFAGAFRRSELVALDVEDLDFNGEGCTVTIRRGKTDQEGAGRKVGLPYGSNARTCPVRALKAWIADSGIAVGPVFRAVTQRGNVASERLSDRAVALIIKRAAEASGMDPTQFAGHSLRAGLATSAAAAGVAERDIMAQTGHTSERTVRRYIREGNLYRSNAAASVGL